MLTLLGLGGEEVAKAIPYHHKSDFAHAGYMPVELGGVTGSGQVRQAGQLAFVRVHDAAHTVTFHQPALSQAVFQRANAGRDIATGLLIADDAYVTSGPSSAWGIRNALPQIPSHTCYTLSLGTCNSTQLNAYLDGSGIVQDDFLVAYSDGRCSTNPIAPCNSSSTSSALAATEQTVFQNLHSSRMSWLSGTGLGLFSLTWLLTMIVTVMRSQGGGCAGLHSLLWGIFVRTDRCRSSDSERLSSCSFNEAEESEDESYHQRAFTNVSREGSTVSILLSCC